MAPCTTKSKRRRPAGATPGAVVRASHCCGTTRPSAPTASRATCTHARSRTKPRRGSKPVRGQATKWSPNASACPWQPGAPSPPQCRAVNGSGRRRRRLRAMCIIFFNQVWGQGRSCVSRYSGEPHARMLPKLRAKEGSRIGRHGREQLAFSEGRVECENSASLPARATEPELTVCSRDLGPVGTNRPVRPLIPTSHV